MLFSKQIYIQSVPSFSALGLKDKQSTARIRAGNRADWAGPKLARFFRVKLLVAQPALKTGLVGPNSLLKAKKIRTGRAGSGHTGSGHIRPSQIWPVFFRANNLMAQPGSNSGWTGLAHRAGPIFPPLARIHPSFY